MAVSVYLAILLLPLSKISTPVLVNETLAAIDCDAVVNEAVDSPIATTLASNDAVCWPIDTTLSSNDAVCWPIETTLASKDDVDWPISTTLVFKDAVDSPIASRCDLAEPPVILTSPVSWIADAVICPLDLSLKISLELDIELDDMVNPPISPVVAVTVPSIVTLPLLSRWNLLELISILPFEPLTNCESPPKKNLSPRILTFEPLKNTLSDFNTNDFVGVPSLPDTDWPKDIKLSSSALNRKPPLAEINAVNSELSTTFICPPILAWFVQ